ncbi:queuine tRNA-ribosyltransferase accessory subunit 2 isoform X2 [Diachasma alloeum]|uniref:queuine tRNA-ribosyltransferase accessory subunit 2 isoform X2 n=1 Tax=Diachasma alloeum TaxID=454923 RepID=UPI0007382226|nr:queuine tRNA-ribosyltransferase accessory subunit 2 isoform X2 [Diachasma alloeum]
MKFITDSVSRCARLGTLSELEKFPEAIFETPLLLVYTREYPTMLTIQDPSKKTPRGYQKHITTAIWTKHGHHAITPDIYMNLVEAFKPDIYVALCDGDSNEETSEKKITKIVERSKRQFEKCFERHKSSDILKNTCMLGAVEGGYDLTAREQSARFLREKNLEGYVIDGLHVNGPEVQNISFGKIKEVVHHTLDLLPPEKLKVSMGCWSPNVLLELIDSGVDIFDSSYPYVMTETAKAITFTCDSHNHGNNYNPGLVISISDKSYVEDFSPICDRCQCLTCKNHTRAYLNHLYNTKELLFSVLLMMHNTHTYLEFFKTIREHIRKGTFQQFKKQFIDKFS